MKDNKRFLNELFRIVNGALRLDIDKVRNYTEFLAEKLDAAGDKSSAERLRKMLLENDHQLRPVGTTFAQTVPVDTETRFPLLEKANIKHILEPAVFLTQDQWDTVNEFLSVAKSYGQLTDQAVGIPLSFLMYGPPGTGKSRLARFIARELSMDLYIARLDGLISSYLGNTSKNIRALFDFATKTPCILFLDEFDAIAKLRGDTQELGELKRVVNSFIQNLDSLGTQSIVLAATNHEELLDSAIWRRFSYRLALGYPNKEIRKKMWKEFLDSIMEPTPKESDLLVDLSEGFSGSDIQEVCHRLQRRKVATKSSIRMSDVFRILQNIAIGEGEGRRFVAQLKNKDEHDSVTVLRNRNPKLYSHSALGDLLGVSKATSYRWAKEVNKDAN